LEKECDITISNILGRLFKGDRGMFSRDRPEEFDYFVISYPKEGGESKKVKFDLGNGKFITDMTMYVMKGGDLVCSGLFSEKGTYSVKGTFYFRKKHKTGEIYSLNTKEFDFDFRSELLSNRGKKKTKKAEKKNDKRKEAELFQYSLKDFVRRSDGGAVLVAEQFYVRTTTSQTPGINGINDQRIDYHYTYGDIIVVNINPDGSIAWANHIPKRQVTTNDNGYFSSYSFAVKGGAIYIMFNDNPKNFGQKLTGSKIPRFNGRRSEAALVVIKSDGSQKKYKMFNNKELGTLMRPKVYKQVGNDELIICTEWRRNIKLGRVKFD